MVQRPPSIERVGLLHLCLGTKEATWPLKERWASAVPLGTVHWCWERASSPEAQPAAGSDLG